MRPCLLFHQDEVQAAPKAVSTKYSLLSDHTTLSFVSQDEVQAAQHKLLEKALSNIHCSLSDHKTLCFVFQDKVQAAQKAVSTKYRLLSDHKTL